MAGASRQGPVADGPDWPDRTQSCYVPGMARSADQGVSHAIMYILAATLIVCLAVVILFKGVDTVPHGWIGVAVTLALAVLALAMTRLKFGDDTGH